MNKIKTDHRVVIHSTKKILMPFVFQEFLKTLKLFLSS